MGFRVSRDLRTIPKGIAGGYTEAYDNKLAKLAHVSVVVTKLQ
jgi:hypothetical protein